MQIVFSQTEPFLTVPLACIMRVALAKTLEVGIFIHCMLKDSVLFLPTTISQYFYCYLKPRS